MRSVLDRKNLPFLVSGAFFLLLLGVMVYLDARSTHGTLYYPLDDTYIHMAIAKNLATHGVWGATRYHFAAASSSILYSLVLAGSFFVFGVRDGIPLALGIVSVLLALWTIHRGLVRLGASPWFIFGAELLLVLVVPLPSTALLGMEHGFQLLFVMMLAFYAARLIDSETAPTSKELASLALLSALVEGFRFESAFVVLVLAVGFFLRKRFAAGFAMGFGTILPVAIFGLVSTLQGWPWLPPPILLKGNMPHGGSIRTLLADLGGTAIRTLAWNDLLLLLVTVATLLFIVLLVKGRRWWEKIPLLLATFVATCMLHLQFAAVGWFMRYEMYLLAFGIVASAAALDLLYKEAPATFAPALRRYWLPTAVLALFMSVPMIQRSFNALKKYVQSGRDNWQIHVRPALFIKRYYNNSTVAVNDLGAMAYYTDANIIDLYGLGDIMPYRLRHSPEGFTKDSLGKWIAGAGASVAVVQTGWIEVRGRVPDSWTEVGAFHAERNVVWGDLDIGFFSIPPADPAQLKANLEQFDREVPMK